MNNKKSTKRALLTSVLSLVLCMSMLIGTTFAWFTDSVTSGRNKIVAGNLDVVLEYKTPDSTDWAEVTSDTILFDENALWEPGHTEVVALRIRNAGTLALNYKLATQIFEETAGTNVAGEQFFLSDYLEVYHSAINGDGQIGDILMDMMLNNRNNAVSGVEIGFNTDVEIPDNQLVSGEADVVALAITMPETVGNEANYKTGTTPPSISFGVTLLASQSTYEEDSFGNDYDEKALWPQATYTEVLTGYANYDATAAQYNVDLNNEDISDDGDFVKRGAMVIPAEAVKAGFDPKVVVKKLTATDKTVPVGDAQEAVTFDVSVEGLKEDNTAPIEVTLNVGKGLADVTVYHKDQLMTGAVYNPTAGTVIFKTTSFSPFTVVYDFDPEAATDFEEPKAVVSDANQYEGVKLEWNDDLGLVPSDENQTLDAVYTFKAPHNSTTVEKSVYRNWHCDYYVMLKSDTLKTLPEGYITLAGNYGTWGWVGFDNPEVNANEFIPLLGSVTNNPWTYEQVVDFVETFICGVGETATAGDALNGAEFVVQLRLTNPDNEEDIIISSEIVHKFN